MRLGGWQVTEDVDDFPPGPGTVLRSHLALRAMLLALVERLRTGWVEEATLFGWLKRGPRFVVSSTASRPVG